MTEAYDPDVSGRWSDTDDYPGGGIDQHRKAKPGRLRIGYFYDAWATGISGAWRALAITLLLVLGGILLGLLFLVLPIWLLG